MEHGQITLERIPPARLVAWSIRFFLAAALTATRMPGGYAPFALGFLAAAGPGGEGASALAGTAVGAALFLDFADALPHLAVAILILAAATAFRGVPLLTRPAAQSAAAAGAFLAVGLIYVTQSLAPLEALTPCLAAAGMTAASVWVFRPVLQPGEDRAFSDGLVYLAAALLLAVNDVAVFGFSVGRMLLCLLLVYTAYEKGALAGGSVGLGVGLAADLCVGTGSGIFTAAFGLAGFAAGGCMGRKRTAAALAYLAAVMAALLPAREAPAQALLMEAAVSGTVFLLLPGRLFGGKRIKRAEPETDGGNRVRERLAKAAAALREVYDSMGRSAPQATDENPAIIFDRAAERVCRGCALCDLCWQKEYTGTFNALNDATPYLLERGRGMAKDFPRYFADRCIHLTDFITAVNGELSAFLLRRQYRRQLEETRRSARGQYAQLSELLTATAAGLEEETAADTVCCRIGAALRPKEGEGVCGDTLDSFRTDRGIWCLLLADGMGSGEEARRESALTCRLLRQFLEADIQPEAALKTLNTAMALRGAETGSFTTVDLCVFAPGRGEACFYKYGAAPSYLKRGGSVRRITGVGLPAGLRGTPALPDTTRVSLEAGSFVVMISDGVADPGEDEWLQDLLAGWSGEDPQVLAGLILSESARREHLRDDCAVQVLYCPEQRTKKV